MITSPILPGEGITDASKHISSSVGGKRNLYRVVAGTIIGMLYVSPTFLGTLVPPHPNHCFFIWLPMKIPEAGTFS